MNTKDAIYLRLFHGRASRDQQLTDWGAEGPVIGPVGLSWTYGTVKVHEVGPDGTWGGHIELPEQDGLIHMAGCWYGDMEVWTPDGMWVEDARKAGRVVAFGELEAVMKADQKWAQIGMDDLEIICYRDEDGKPWADDKGVIEAAAKCDREEHEEQIASGERDAEDAYEEDPIRPCVQLPGGALIMQDDGALVPVE